MGQLHESLKAPLTERPQTHHGSRPGEQGCRLIASDQEYLVDDNQ